MRALRRNSPSSARPSTSSAMGCVRSPFATALIVRVTSAVGHTRSSISVLIDSTFSDQPPVAPCRVTRCFRRPFLPTARLTRAVSSPSLAVRAVMSLSVSAIFPYTPVQSDGSRTEKSPPLNASNTARISRISWLTSPAEPVAGDLTEGAFATAFFAATAAGGLLFMSDCETLAPAFARAWNAGLS